MARILLTSSCAVLVTLWHMEESDGQQLWRTVGGKERTIRRGEHGMKQDTQLSIQSTRSSSN